MQRLLIEILYCDRANIRNKGKVAVVELSYEDGIYKVLTHGLRADPQKRQLRKPVSKMRLESEYEDNASTMFKSILAEKQKIGFRFLADGEKLNVPYFNEIFKDTDRTEKNKNTLKITQTNQVEEFRKLAI
jgi:hypothetical protein